MTQKEIDDLKETDPVLWKTITDGQKWNDELGQKMVDAINEAKRKGEEIY